MNKKIAAGAAAAVLAASVVTNNAFEPEELVHSEEYLARHRQSERVPAAAEDVTLAELPAYEQMSLADAVRAWFIAMPVAVKAAVLLPLWCLGALPAALLTALAPFWSVLLSFVLQAAVLVGLFCLVYKLLFPEKKLRDLFRKKNLKWLLLGAVTVTAANVALAQLWSGWPVLRAVLLAAVGFGVLVLLWKRLCGKFKAPEPDTVRTRLVLEY